MHSLKKHKSVYGALALIVIITALLYSRTTDFSFIGYDDDVYILNNDDIRDFSAKGIKKILFNPDNPEQMKPPVTVLSLAMNYEFGRLDPSGYRLTNLILHLINVVLAFAVVNLITARRDIALFAAGVFALHPSAAEVVAWATARKDLLYGLFYLLALFVTFKYWKTGKIYFYFFTVIFFVLSYYSKYAAASFPVLYLVLGLLYYRRKNTLRTVMESIPFFIPPLYSFYRSVRPASSSASPSPSPNSMEKTEEITRLPETAAQAASAAQDITVYESFNLIQKFFLGGYSFIQYLIKFIFPVNQQLIYPYPPIDAKGNLPAEYYIFTGLALLIAGGIIYLFVKRKSLIRNELGFGVLFFGVTVTLLLHVLPIGGRVVIADRYMYLPFIGLSVIFYYLLQQAAVKSNFSRLPKIAGAVFLVILALKVNDRIPDWENTEVVFTDLIEKEAPTAIPYNNLGKHYEERGQYDRALKLLNKALEMDPNYVEAIMNRGSVLHDLGKPEQSLSEFKRIIKSKPSYSLAWYNAGTSFEALKMYDSAFHYYDRALELDPGFHLALNNYGVILMDHKKEYKEAEKYFRKAVEQKSDFARAYNNIGIVHRLGYEDIEGALKYFEKSARVDPDFMDGHLNIARIYMDQERLDEAENKLKFIVSKKPNYSFAYFNLGIVYLQKGDRESGCQNLKTAYQKGFSQAGPYLKKYCE